MSSPIKKNEKSKLSQGFDDFFKHIYTHLYGIVSVLSLIISIVISILTFNNPKGVDVQNILYILTGLIAVLTISIISISVKYAKYEDISKIKERLESDNDKLSLLLLRQSEAIHNITHYHRDFIFVLDDYIKEYITDNKNFDTSKTDYILDQNESFLIFLTTTLQNFLSLYTDDNCSITLKLLHGNKNYIKTVFRDPVNLKKRRQAELQYSKEFFPISENSAFELVVSSEYTNRYFANDDLKSLYDIHQYKNSNPQWFYLYNSTIVVPISKVLDEPNRHIVGFIAVDNFKGGLADDNVLEFLLSISDLLYNYFIKIHHFVSYTDLNNYKNEKTERFSFRSNGK